MVARRLSIFIAGICGSLFFVSGTPLAQVVQNDTLFIADTTFVDLPEDLFDSFGDDEEAIGDPSDLLDMLENLQQNPLDINTATVSDFSSIPVLTPRMANEIVAYREENGPYTSIPELRLVESITPEIWLAIRPYLMIGEELVVDHTRQALFPSVPRISDLQRNARFEVLQRFQRRMNPGRGYDSVPDSLIGTPDEPRHYLGGPERVYTRVRLTSGRHFSANVTLESDPGEPFTWNASDAFYGYDFVSFHASASSMGRLEMLVIGDYVAEFGQGLTLWRAAGFGKGSETVRPLVRRGRGIRPYSSTDENRFFRGAAASVAITPNIYVSGFASRRHYDARITEIDTTALIQTEVETMPVTGLHRTHTEIAQKNSLGQTLFGGSAEYRTRTTTVGLVGYTASFDHPLTAGNQPYQRFQFEGDQAHMISLYGNAFLGDYYAFGEIGRDVNGRFAGIGGIEGDLGPLNALLLVRHYPREFVSIHGHAFGERNGATQNESGVYLGGILRPSSQWILKGYFDQYRFPWARYTVNRPSTGYDALLYVEHRPRRWVSIYTQARTRVREMGTRYTTPTGAEIDGLELESRQSLRIQGMYEASRSLRFRARVEAAQYRRGEAGQLERGVMMFHDVRWLPIPTLTIDARITYFETDSFGARLYQFENDLLGVMSNALLSGRGTRSYVVIGYRPTGLFDGLNMRFKISQTYFTDRETVGSGLDQVEGNSVVDIGLQIRYTF